MTNEEKLAIVLQLVNGLKANEWRRIKTIIDRQYKKRPPSWHLMTFPANQ